eukprot:g56781.t1
MFWSALLIALVSSERIEWTSAGSGSWHNPSNWDRGRVPNLNDDVVLASLTNWPVLTIASSASARSIFSHETAAFTLAVSSTLQLYQVSHLGSQTNLRLSSGATLFLSDPSILTVNGSVHMYAGSMAGSGQFRNQGTMLLNLSNIGSEVVISCRFSNYGTVELQRGKLRLDAGGANAGPLIVYPGNSTLKVTATTPFLLTTTVSHIYLSGLLQIADTTTIEQLTMDGSNAALSKLGTGYGTYVILDLVTNGGNINSNVIVNTTKATFTPVTYFHINAGATLNLLGSTTWEAGPHTSGTFRDYQGVLNNYGSFSVKAPGWFVISYYTTMVFRNYGTITLSLASASSEAIIQCDFFNYGTVELQRGKLRLDAGGANAGPLIVYPGNSTLKVTATTDPFLLTTTVSHIYLSGLLQIADTTTIQQLTMDNSNAALSKLGASYRTYVILDLVTNGGNINSNVIVNTTKATFTPVTYFHINAGATLNLLGSTTWEAGPHTSGTFRDYQGVLNNYGSFSVKAPGWFVISYYTTMVFRNYGTITLSLASASSEAIIQCDFFNYGTVELQRGKLRLDAGGANAGPLIVYPGNSTLKVTATTDPFLLTTTVSHIYLSGLLQIADTTTIQQLTMDNSNAALSKLGTGYGTYVILDLVTNGGNINSNVIVNTTKATFTPVTYFHINAGATLNLLGSTTWEAGPHTSGTFRDYQGVLNNYGSFSVKAPGWFVISYYTTMVFRNYGTITLSLASASSEAIIQCDFFNYGTVELQRGKLRLDAGGANAGPLIVYPGNSTLKVTATTDPFLLTTTVSHIYLSGLLQIADTTTIQQLTMDNSNAALSKLGTGYGTYVILDLVTNGGNINSNVIVNTTKATFTPVTYFHINAGATLNLLGSTTWEAGPHTSGTFRDYQGVLNNYGSFSVKAPGWFVISYYTTMVFRNYGTITLSLASASSEAIIQCDFFNYGTVELQRGKLRLDAGGANAGPLIVYPGNSTLKVTATTDPFLLTTTVSHIYLSGLLQIADTTTIQQLTMDNSNAALSKLGTGYGTYVILDLVTNGGNINSNVIVNTTKATFTPVTYFHINAGATLNLLGSTTWEAGPHTSGTFRDYQGVLNNYGSFSVKAPGWFVISYYTTMVFRNYGTITLSLASASSEAIIQCDFFNYGTVELQRGKLRLDAGGANAGPLIVYPGNSTLKVTATTDPFLLTTTVSHIYLSGLLQIADTTTIQQLTMDNSNAALSKLGASYRTYVILDLVTNGGNINSNVIVNTTKATFTPVTYFHINAGATLNLLGSTTWEAGPHTSGTFRDYQGVLNNYGSFSVKAPGWFVISYYTTMVFRNYGTITLSLASASFEAIIQCDFFNYGTVELQRGKLRLDAGGANAGSLIVYPGNSTLKVTATTDPFLLTTTVSHIYLSGLLQIADTTTIQQLTMDNSNAALSKLGTGYGTYVILDLVTNGGNINSNVIVNTTKATFTPVTYFHINAGATLNLLGSTTWEAGPHTSGTFRDYQGVLNNYGNFSVKAPGWFVIQYYTTMVFRNYGTIKVTLPTLASSAIIQCNFFNYGTVEVHTGEIKFQYSLSLQSQSNLYLAANGTLTSTSSLSVPAHAKVGGCGIIKSPPGFSLLADGVLALGCLPEGSGDLRFQGGSVTSNAQSRILVYFNEDNVTNGKLAVDTASTLRGRLALVLVGLPPNTFNASAKLRVASYPSTSTVTFTYEDSDAANLQIDISPIATNLTVTPCSFYDVCYVCEGNGTSCLSGCDNKPFSMLKFDLCGICDGNNRGCCSNHGQYNGTHCICDGSYCGQNCSKVLDSCSVCGGNCGSSCSDAVNCRAGLLCVDGVCCTSSCDGLCETCALAGFLGQCKPQYLNTDPDDDCATCAACNGARACQNVSAGTDPINDCLVSAVLTCGLDGFCDGIGHCRLYSTSVLCQSHSCANGVEQLGKNCDGSGACSVYNGNSSCSPYVCAGSSTCYYSCWSVGHSACEATHYCSGTACVPKLADGSVCAFDEMCEHNDCQCGECGGNATSGCPGDFCSNSSDCSQSLECVDGVCCTSSCDGLCESCALAGFLGQCKPQYLNTDPDDDCATCAACNGARACQNVSAGTDPINDCLVSAVLTCGLDGFCDGIGHCRLYSTSVLCQSHSCANGVEQLGKNCDGSGACSVYNGNSSCSPYVCAGSSTCYYSCWSVGHSACEATHYCSGTACVPKLPSGSPCSDSVVCLSGACLCNGTCGAIGTGGCIAAGVKSGNIFVSMLKFGNNLVGSGIQNMSLELHNLGTLPLELGANATQLLGADANSFSASRLPSSLSIGSSTPFWVSFVPTTPGSKVALLRIGSVFNLTLHASTELPADSTSKLDCQLPLLLDYPMSCSLHLRNNNVSIVGSGPQFNSFTVDSTAKRLNISTRFTDISLSDWASPLDDAKLIFVFKEGLGVPLWSFGPVTTRAGSVIASFAVATALSVAQAQAAVIDLLSLGHGAFQSPVITPSFIQATLANQVWALDGSSVSFSLTFPRAAGFLPFQNIALLVSVNGQSLVEQPASIQLMLTPTIAPPAPLPPGSNSSNFLAINPFASSLVPLTLPATDEVRCVMMPNSDVGVTDAATLFTLISGQTTLALANTEVLVPVVVPSALTSADYSVVCVSSSGLSAVFGVALLPSQSLSEGEQALVA